MGWVKEMENKKELPKRKDISADEYGRPQVARTVY